MCLLPLCSWPPWLPPPLWFSVWYQYLLPIVSSQFFCYLQCFWMPGICLLLEFLWEALFFNSCIGKMRFFFHIIPTSTTHTHGKFLILSPLLEETLKTLSSLLHFFPHFNWAVQSRTLVREDTDVHLFQERISRSLEMCFKATTNDLNEISVVSQQTLL